MVYKKIFIPALLSFVVFCLYLHNLSRSVYGGDVGDLVTAAFVGGVAHPPGYPLFTFLGFLLTRIHFFPSAAFAVGLISVVSGALGVFFFYLTIQQLVKSTFVSMISTLLLAFSYLFWFYSEIAEVFALNSFFFIVLMYLGVKIYREKSVKLFFFFFFILGLSLTNHQTIVLVVPSLVLLVLPQFLQSKEKKKLTLLGLGGFLGGLGAYMYVPIASFFHPVLNWDTVKDLSSFLHLVLRRDYGTFSAGLFVAPSFLQRLIVLKAYMTELLIQLTIPVVALCIIGLFFAWKKYKLLTVSLLLGFLLSGPFFLYYAGFPLTGNFYFGVNERFFLLSTICILYFFPCGLFLLSNLFKKVSHVPVILFQAVFLIIPLMLFSFNYPKTNLSQVFIGDYYGKDVFISLPDKAVLFVAGDTIIFNTWYTHYVQNVRPDVHVLNINGNIASPYYTILEAKYKKSFPHATPAQVQVGIIAALPQDGSVFSVEELQPASGKKFTWIPYGLLFQLVLADQQPKEAAFTQKEDFIWSRMHIPHASQKSFAEHSLTISDIPNSYANAMLVTGNFYFSHFSDMKKAKEWYEKARAVAPEYEKTYSSLGVYYLSVDKQCLAAKDNFTKAIDLNPVEPLNYFLLYATDTNCLHDTKGAYAVKTHFEKQFQTSFSKLFSKYSPTIKNK